MKCLNVTCPDYGVERELHDYDGSWVICGTCGDTIQDEQSWHTPVDISGIAEGVPAVELIAAQLSKLPPDAVATLLNLLTNALED